MSSFLFSGCGGESEKGDKSASGQNGSPADSSSITSVSGGGASTSSGTSSDGGGNQAANTTNAVSSGGVGGGTTSDGTVGGGAGLGGAGGSTGGHMACEPQDVSGVGACDAAFGVFFLGAECGWVSGCSCEGADCDKAHEDDASCESANRGCLTDCAPQDITLVGGCEAASIFVFNGIDCVATDGCQCVGDDCGGSYATLEACERAHATCVDRERTCDEVSSIYDEYVGHTACQDDSDCVMVFGQCGIGLGGCHHAVNRRWGAQALSELAEIWLDMGCSGPVCDCAAPPEGAYCDAGMCTPLQ